MNAPDPRIIRFIRKHHVFTLATTVNQQPWCACCFYVFDEQTISLVFTSDTDTRHISEALSNPQVAGNIALETKIIGLIQGLQFSGILHQLEGEDYEKAKNQYLKRFPYAAPFLGATAIWNLEISMMKMTDNKLGFGKKLLWYKNA